MIIIVSLDLALEDACTLLLYIHEALLSTTSPFTWMIGISSTGTFDVDCSSEPEIYKSLSELRKE